MRRLRQAQPRRGFTLIELLVVIAIIAILAAILFPVFARAREKARQTSCLSNVKQIALAAHMYAQDYDEKWPRCSLYTPDWSQGWFWYSLVMPYINNWQILVCPSEPGYYCGYGWNGWLTGYHYHTIDLPLGKVDRPAETIFIADSERWTASETQGSPGKTIYKPAYSTYCSPTGGVKCRHNDGANWGFFDGHAKWLRLDATGPYQDQGSMWGYDNLGNPY